MHRSRATLRNSGAKSLVPCALLLLVGGCGSGIEVTGKVTNKGTAVPNADIRFVSEDGSKVFTSVSRDDGNFKLDPRGENGIPKGKYKITVTWWTVKEGGAFLANDEQSQLLKGTDATLRYWVTFEKEVTDETTAFDIEVSEYFKK